MDRTLADELYADTLEVSNGGSGPMASAGHILVDSYGTDKLFWLTSFLESLKLNMTW